MASEQEQRAELDARARKGETVVPGGTGGKSYEAQQHLAEGRSRGGQIRKEQLGIEGYQEMGSRGGQARKDQTGPGPQKDRRQKVELSRSVPDESGGARSTLEGKGIDIDESIG